MDTKRTAPQDVEVGSKRGDIERLQDELRLAQQRVLDLEQSLARLDSAAATSATEVGQSEKQRQTEELLRRFYNAAQQSTSLIIIMDVHGKIEYVNPSYCDMMRCAPDDAIGHDFHDVTGSGLDLVWEGLQRDSVWRGNAVLHRSDGSELLTTGSITPLRSDAGEVTHWLGIMLDTTEQQRIEREKNESDARFRCLVEANVLGIMLAYGDGTITYANDAFLNTLGYTREDLAQNRLNWRQLTPPEHQDATERALSDIARQNFVAPFEKEYICKDGGRVPVLVGIARIGDSDCRIACVLDLTAQKYTEAKLKRMAADLARSNADLQQFAYIVSHDLQEPLRMIGGFLQMLQKRHGQELSPQAKELVEKAAEGAAGMQSLIHDLLEFSRVDNDDREHEGGDANVAFDTAAANLRGRIDETRAVVERAQLPRVAIDGVQMVEVFQNLLSNALKFRRARVRPKIRVTARRSEDAWVFTVKDNGIGIDPGQQEKIFTVFQRLHPRSVYPGNGIGLAITKKIVERHGGHIWVESTLGHGSAFHFSVPDGRRVKETVVARRRQAFS